MIHFSLHCAAGHEFEAWFRNGKDFDEQAAGARIACPSCGDTRVAKSLMAPAVSPKSVGRGPSPAEVREKLTALRNHVEKTCDYVGRRFPEEARKIHYGEVEARNIYGEATTDEAKRLKEEGVPAEPIPWVRRADS